MMRTYLSPNLPKSTSSRGIGFVNATSINFRLIRTTSKIGFINVPSEYLLGRGKICRRSAWPSHDLAVGFKDQPAGQQRSFDCHGGTNYRCRKSCRFVRDSTESRRNRQMYLLTQLEAAKRIAGPNLMVDVEAFLKSFPRMPMPTKLRRFWRRRFA